MKKCLKKEIILQYIDNEFRAKKQKKIAAHLSGCHKCRQEAERIKSKMNFVSSKIEMIDPPGDFKIAFSLPEDPVGRKTIFKKMFANIRPAFILKPALITVIFVLIAAVVIMMLPGGDKETRQLLIHSVRMEGQPAQTYIIEEKESKTTLIWIEKKDKKEKKNENYI